MSSFDLVNAPDSIPFSCFCGTSGQPPFIRTSIARPGGGIYFVCGNCARRIMAAYGVVAKADADTVQEQLRLANEKGAELDAATTRGDVLQAEVANRDAELDLLRAENVTLTTAFAQAQRDIEDLTNGLMPDSWLAQARDAIAAGDRGARPASLRPQEEACLPTDGGEQPAGLGGPLAVDQHRRL